MSKIRPQNFEMQLKTIKLNKIQVYDYEVMLYDCMFKQNFLKSLNFFDGIILMNLRFSMTFIKSGR